jgi:hypothetical protein
MIVEKQMECRLAGETEILGENLPQHRGGKPATNRLSYGAALVLIYESVTSSASVIIWLTLHK